MGNWIPYSPRPSAISGIHCHKRGSASLLFTIQAVLEKKEHTGSQHSIFELLDNCGLALPEGKLRYEIFVREPGNLLFSLMGNWDGNEEKAIQLVF